MVDLSLCIGCPIIQLVFCGLMKSKDKASFLTASQDYIVQAFRFQIIEELGCFNAPGNMGLSILLIQTSGVVLPLISLVLYSREQSTNINLHRCLLLIFTARLFLTYFRHRRDLDEALGTNATIDKESFIKFIAYNPVGWISAFTATSKR